MGNLEVEDNNKEEDLVMEEANSYVITVDIQEIFPKITKVLQKHVRIANNLIILLNSVRN